MTSMTTKMMIDDERSLRGFYKANGLTDSDAIYAEKRVLLKGHVISKRLSWVGFFMFAFVALLLGAGIGSFIMLGFASLPAIFVFFRIRKHKKMIKMINSVTAEYCKEIGVEPV